MGKEADYANMFVQGRTADRRGVSGKEHKPEGRSKELHAFFVKAIDAEKKQITAYASTGILDRYGDIVEPEAFRETMPEYMKNPVVLAAHSHRLDSGHSPVVGNVIKWWIDKIGLGVVIQFSDKTELAREYWGLYSEKTQRAFSIGFSILESHDEMRDGQRVNIITKLELYEISCVPVPANPEALSKSKQRKRDFVAGKIFDRANMKLPSDEESDEFARLLLGVSEQDTFESDETETIEPDYFAKMVCESEPDNFINW